MRRCRWCLALLTSLLLTAGCVSTLPPPASTYSFDRRCLSVASEVAQPACKPGRTAAGAERRRRERRGGQALFTHGVHIADVMGLLPPLNRLAQLEVEQAA